MNQPPSLLGNIIVMGWNYLPNNFRAIIAYSPEAYTDIEWANEVCIMTPADWTANLRNQDYNVPTGIEAQLLSRTEGIPRAEIPLGLLCQYCQDVGLELVRMRIRRIAQKCGLNSSHLK